MPVDWRRLRRPATVFALVLSFAGAVGTSLGSVVAGRLAEDPTRVLVILLAVCVVGAALIDTVAKTIWATVVDRAEGRLRADLLDAALAQPLSELGEQAVGEVLDRIDDDSGKSARCCGGRSGWPCAPCWPPARCGSWRP